MSDSAIHALAGATGSVFAMTLTYPLITVATKSSVDSKTKSSQIKTLRKILKEEGPIGLYAGLESALFGISVTSAVYYYWYELVKAGFQARLAAEKAISVVENMITGTIAGTITSVLTNPIWVINTRLMVGNEKKMGISKAAKLIIKESGYSGFFRGIVPALILVSNPVIQYTVFERLRLWKETARKLTSFDIFVLGAFAKLVATAITYPYLVVKSRMHLKDSENEDEKYFGIIDGFQKILKSEGLIGLYKGIETKLLQSVLTAAFTFAFKEEIYKFVNVLMRIKKQ